MITSERVQEWLEEYGEVDLLNEAACRSLAEKLAKRINSEILHLENDNKKKHIQESGPRCKNCGAFTTYMRVYTHGLCMRCENFKGK
ncbi:MAG TPA: hypothetical protein VFA52_04295 [Candidatus Paceibacterota bacterium]|nr:hypothetical protein [Candidatus Paceibacterota bacterium]